MIWIYFSDYKEDSKGGSRKLAVALRKITLLD